MNLLAFWPFANTEIDLLLFKVTNLLSFGEFGTQFARQFGINISKPFVANSSCSY